MPIALILAAGSGERLGAKEPKALVELAGRPLLQWSVDVLREVVGIERIVIALPPGTPALSGVTGVDGRTLAVEGGAVRSESVRLALVAAGSGSDQDLVLVHDAARPLLTVALAQATIRALEEDETIDGAIAAVPMTDTVKRVADGVVSETLDRSQLWAVQTPQVFRRAALERALDVPEEVLAQATDDAWLIERAGGRVSVVKASSENLKVTTPLDLRMAEMLLLARTA
jgi:2-C-methyl-D-erythritol 4-phosphate cytidylyltransferase